VIIFISEDNVNTKTKTFIIFAIVATTLAAEKYSPKIDINDIKDLLKYQVQNPQVITVI